MFDPVKRDDMEQIKLQAKRLLQSEYFSYLLGSLPNIVLILNENRQVIYNNKHVLAELNLEIDKDDIIGLRPGECLNCIHAGEGKHGCGSTEYCSVCGLANGVLLSERNMNGNQECRVSLTNGTTIILEAVTKPFMFEDNHYVLCSLVDISDQKHKEMLENIFLHDLQNTAGNFYSLSNNVDLFDKDEVFSFLKDNSQVLLEEIESYKLMLSAEKETLKVKKVEFKIIDLLESVKEALKKHISFLNSDIIIECPDVTIDNDRIILRRILFNLMKNALETGGDNKKVRVKVEIIDNICKIDVYNDFVISHDNQLKIFQKSFSTKGAGRGLGTYSIKLLTEKYLNGSVYFVSNEDQGTIFSLVISR